MFLSGELRGNSTCRASPPANCATLNTPDHLFGARRMRPSCGDGYSRMGLHARRLRQSGWFREPVQPEQPAGEIRVAPLQCLQHGFVGPVGKLLVHPWTLYLPELKKRCSDHGIRGAITAKQTIDFQSALTIEAAPYPRFGHNEPMDDERGRLLRRPFSYLRIRRIVLDKTSRIRLSQRSSSSRFSCAASSAMAFAGVVRRAS